jgi:hypothetical protein
MVVNPGKEAASLTSVLVSLDEALGLQVIPEAK